jgi:hypothetical protein
MATKLTEILTSHANGTDASKPSEGERGHKMAYTRYCRARASPYDGYD